MTEDVPKSFVPNPWDVRVERDGWVYWIRAVKRPQSLRASLSWDGSIDGFLFYITVGWLLQVCLKAVKTWKVGIVAYPAGVVGGRARVVHQVVLPVGEDFRFHLDDLVRQVENGKIRMTVKN